MIVPVLSGLGLTSLALGGAKLIGLAGLTSGIATSIGTLGVSRLIAKNTGFLSRADNNVVYYDGVDPPAQSFDGWSGYNDGLRTVRLDDEYNADNTGYLNRRSYNY